MTSKAYIGDFVAVQTSDADLLNDLKAAQLRWPSIYSAEEIQGAKRLELQGVYAVGVGASVLDLQGDKIFAGLYHPINGDTAQETQMHISNNLKAVNANAFEDVSGKYAHFEASADGDVAVVIDPMRTSALYCYKTNDTVAVSTDIRLLSSALNHRELNYEAIYHYLNYFCIPTPHTLYKGIQKLPPAGFLLKRKGGVSLSRYWKPEYSENYIGSEEEATRELQSKIVSTIEKYQPKGVSSWGTFLSGGNDSSTVTGVLASKNKQIKIDSFSIGFSEEGYDELPYAMIAADCFGTTPYSKRVSAEDALGLIDKIVDIYDEPFGNPSAIPTYFCAQLASEVGKDTLIAGDGGDEVFGGNERYAKDAIFRLFHSLPAPLRSMFVLVAKGLQPFDSRFINRVKNFVSRGSLPNPDRFYSDDSFASDYFEEFLTREFRSQIDRNASLSIMKGHFDEANARSELNKLMYIDLQMAIADNDLSKVNKTAKASGVSVLYPYLDRGLVDFTASLPAKYKVNGTEKRYLFRKAVSNILPDEILSKKKQGFGLPVSVWFRDHPRFIELTNDVLLSDKSRGRGIFNNEFVAQLIERHQKGVWDYNVEIWSLLMLEMWISENIDP